LPGVPSEIQVLGLTEASVVQIQNIVGQPGADGAGGIHGIGAMSGNQCTGRTKGHHWKDVVCNKIKAIDGVDGPPAQNTLGLEPQEGPVVIVGKQNFVNIFKTLLTSNADNHIKKNSLTEFVNILNTNPTIQALQ